MRGRLTLLCTALARVTTGLAVLTAGLLLAPSAAADPIGDANSAITASYDASGGSAGPLGVREGDVYPIGSGFGQNFAAGKMFFTPATGAHFMQGAILEKYESLGGPADSDLGFPTIDEGPGRVGPDSRNATFSAADKPVIFWTPGTGARVVRGAINAAWDKLGGSAGVLGVPAEDEVYRADTVSQKFTGGEVSWNRKTKAFTTVPPDLAGQLGDVQVPEDPASAIAAARRAAGGPLGPLGATDGGQYPIGDDGVGQNFTGGKIFYTPATGANVVTGQVLDKYESVGGPQGDLGFPTSSETDGGLGSNSRVSSFSADDQPVIFWTPDYGPVIVRGAMNAAWAKLDAAKGPLGAPMADASENGDVVTQRFSGGVISYDRSTGKFSTEPGNLAAQLAGLKVPGQEAPKPAAGPQPAAAGDGDSGAHWNRWWLLALIPVLLIAGLAAGVAVRRRRRPRDDGRYAGQDDPFGEEDASYQPVAARRRDADRPGDAQNGYPDSYVESYPAGYGDPAAPGSVFSAADPAPAADASPWNVRATPAVDTEPGDEPAGTEHSNSAEPEEEDPDSVDTAPTRIETEDPFGPLFVDDAPSGRHAAVDIDEPTPGRTAIHLPVGDAGEAPEGYPVKADTRSGLYWTPGSAHYGDAVAELWFASEEFARTNGFVRGD
jgi:uncharacterized protein with LGFP repeats